jgi:hypothetical protein
MTPSVPDLVEHAKTHSRECVEGLTDLTARTWGPTQ